MTKIARLKGFLHNPNYRLRLRAVRSLGEHPTAEAVELLIERLGEFDKADEESKVNFTAACVLASMRAVAFDRLVEELHKKQDQPHDNWRRNWVARALGLTGDPRAVDVLIEILHDEAIRGNAAEALEHLGDKCALEPLIKILPKSKDYAFIAVKHAIKSLQESPD